MKKLVAPLLLSALFLGACSPHSGTRKIEPLFGRRYDSSLSFEENLKAVDYVSLSSMVDDGDDFRSASVVLELESDIIHRPGDKATIMYLEGGKLRVAGSATLE